MGLRQRADLQRGVGGDAAVEEVERARLQDGRDRGGQQVEVRTQILGHDTKRLHLHHSLHLSGEAPMLAASEQMLLNVATAMARAAPFAEPVQSRVEILASAHQALPAPRYAGRAISLARS